MNFVFSLEFSLWHLWHTQVLPWEDGSLYFACCCLCSWVSFKNMFFLIPHLKNSIHRTSLSLSLSHKILAHVFTQETSRERRNALYFTKHSGNEGWVLLQRPFPFLSGCWAQVTTGTPTSESLELAGMRGCWQFFLKMCSRPGRVGTSLKHRQWAHCKRKSCKWPWKDSAM